VVQPASDPSPPTTPAPLAAVSAHAQLPYLPVRAVSAHAQRPYLPVRAVSAHAQRSHPAVHAVSAHASPVPAWRFAPGARTPPHPHAAPGAV